MRVNECMGKEGGKNKAKRGVNSRSGHAFGCLHKAGKFNKSAGVVMVDKRGPWGGLEGKEEARGAIWISKRKEGQKKRTTASKKTKTSKRKFV